jgi:hypothetical protein
LLILEREEEILYHDIQNNEEYTVDLGVISSQEILDFGQARRISGHHVLKSRASDKDEAMHLQGGSCQSSESLNLLSS